MFDLRLAYIAQGIFFLAGIAVSIFIQVQTVDVGSFGGSSFGYCLEQKGWPRAFFTQVKMTSRDWTEVEYKEREFHMQGSALAAGAFIVHFFAMWATAFKTRVSLRWKLGTMFALVTGCAAGLGVFIGIAQVGDPADLLGSAGLGLGAFWMVHLMLKSLRPCGRNCGLGRCSSRPLPGSPSR